MIRHAVPTLALCATLLATASLPGGAQGPASAPKVHAASTGQQAPAPPATKGQQDYAGEPLVLEQISTVYRYRADGTGDRTIHARARIQSEAAARQYGVLYVPYAAEYEQVEMRYLRVHKADGATVETSATDAQDLPAEVTRQAPVYSDRRQKQFPVRSLSVGDTLEYECVIHLNKPQAVDPQGQPQFWGAETLTTNAVALDEVVELHLPRERTAIVSSPRHKPVMEEQAGERIYRWHGTRLKPTVPPPSAAKGAEDKSADPDEETNDGLPDIAWTSFKDWAAVGEWYRSLAGTRAAATPELKARAAALTEGAATDEQKLRRTYAWVSANIRYIGVDFGVGRIQPHAASEVLGNQYGDCKDKHTLLQALLAGVGIHASPVLIGSGIKFNREVPSPSSFNHVITEVELPGAPGQPSRRIWLDSTAEVAPFGVLTAPTRDKDALLVAADGPSTLVKTPAELPFRAYDHWEARGTLDKDGKLTGHFDITMRGDLELLMRWAVRQTTAAQWQQLGQNVSNSLGFGGTVSDFAPGPAEKTDEPFHYSYDYERPTYGDWPNHRILSLIPYGLFATQTLEKKPIDPISTGSPRLESAHSVIHLPVGYSATLPEPIHIQSSFANYDVTFTAKDSDVICETKLEIRTTSVPAAQWEEYNAFAKSVQENGEIFVQLHAPGEAQDATAASKVAEPGAMDGASEAGSKGNVNDVNASALLDEAWKLIQAGDVPGAEAKLDAARKLNPDQWGTWAVAGMIAASHRNYDEAEANYSKELALHPENDFALRSLAGTQAFRKERPQAIATLQKLVKLKPDEPNLTLQLSNLLTQEKRYPEALTILQAAAFKNPGNKGIILALGTTQLAAGRTEEAVATLHTALEDATDPLVLNNAAYELAQHDADLPLAEKSARKALTLLDAETQKFTLASVTPDQLGRTMLLSDTWDTLGWIEFKEGEAKEAEPLLAAAWASAQHAAVGYHLGRVYEKLGKPKQAYEAYRSARAALGAGETFASVDDIDARIAALEKAGVTASTFDRNDLGGSRIYTLPLLTKKKTEGDYFLLLSSGKVEAASWIKGDEELKPLEPKLASSLQSALTSGEKPALFPKNSGAKQVRRGVLSCSPMLHSCMIVLMLPQDARIDVKSLTLQITDNRPANAQK